MGLDIQLQTGVPAASPHASSHEKGGDDGIATLGNLAVDSLTTAGDVDTSANLKADTIAEHTAATGVTIDGVLLKDSEVTTDVINEKTAAAGVTIDTVLLKDDIVECSKYQLNDDNTTITEVSSDMTFKDANAAPNGITLLQLLRGFRDDFLGDTLDTKWNTATSGTGAAVGLVDDDTNRVGGWYRLTTGTDDDGYAKLDFNAIECLNATGGYLLIWRCQASSTSSADYRFHAYDDSNNYIRVRYDTDASESTWHLFTNSVGSETDTDTSLAPDTSAHWFLLDVSSSSVKLYIDGVLKATSTTNIPTTNAQIDILSRTRNTTSKNLDLDFIGIIPK